jgi:hypothetical protein
MDTNGMSDDEQMAWLEMVAKLPDFIAWGTELALVVEGALDAVLDGRRMQSCLHAVDQATGIVVGQVKTTDRVAFFCPAHPTRLLCDNPGNHIGPGCMHHHMLTEHRDEFPAMCFVCHQPIEPELLVTPVFGKIELHRSVPVYYDWQSEYQYLGPLRTLPVTYLCPRHSRLFDVRKPWVINWPMDAEHVTPEDFM